MSSIEQKKVKLTSSEGTEFQVERSVAERSVLLKNMLEDVGENDMGKHLKILSSYRLIVKKMLTLQFIFNLFVSNIIIAIPLPNVTGPILTKVIDYCTHHRNDPIQNHDDDLKKTSEDIDDWDAEFCKVDQGTLFELILVNKIIYIYKKNIYSRIINE